MNTGIDFGYPWFITYGHLVVTAIAVCLLVAGRMWKWPRIPMILAAALLIWSIFGLAVARFGLNANGRGRLPTQHFLASGEGRVLDMGAGTGRSSIMVLDARPKVTLVALDLFGKSYEQHFGSPETGQQRLLANLRAAGVEQRATIQTGDMRKLPLETISFDGVVSAYAIDHLNREGISAALSEAHRVLKPRGEFLLMVVTKEPWLLVACGPMLLHSHMQGDGWWRSRLREAGFEVLESGTRPATLYLLARKP